MNTGLGACGKENGTLTLASWDHRNYVKRRSQAFFPLQLERTYLALFFLAAGDFTAVEWMII